MLLSKSIEVQKKFKIRDFNITHRSLTMYNLVADRTDRSHLQVSAKQYDSLCFLVKSALDMVLQVWKKS